MLLHQRPLVHFGRPWLVALAAAAVFGAPTASNGERLPIRSFTTADGLAHDRVRRIVRDSRGFLWFCTAGGLSRFDGRRFVSYSEQDGLPASTLNDLLENPDGTYWLATNGAGLVRYDPAPASRASVRGTGARFTPFTIGGEPAANRANQLFRDLEGRLWIGTDAGLFILEQEENRPTFRRIPLGILLHPDRVLQVWAVAADPGGSLWIGTSAGLLRRLPDGRVTHHRVRPARTTDHVWALLIDPQGRLWIEHQTGLLVLETLPATAPGSALGDQGLWYTAAGLPVVWSNALLRASDGRVWVGTDAGVSEIATGGMTSYGSAHGLEGSVVALAEDSSGNIWAGTEASGAIRIPRRGFTTYTKADGLSEQEIGSVFETTAGQLCVVTRGPRLHVFDGHRFRAVVPNIPAGQLANRGESYAAALQDRAGEWWIPSGETLYRFAPVADVAALRTAAPRAVYKLGTAPASRGVWRLFDDSRGDVWIAMRVAAEGALTRWERTTGRIHRYSERDGLPASPPHAFAEDRAGNVWIGFWDAGLARYRDGRFQTFSAADGAPAGGVSALRVDHAGRLWLGTAAGLFRIDDPNADRPRLVRYPPEGVLADARITSIGEDRSGHLYIGTLRGLDRLDQRSGRMRHSPMGEGSLLETKIAYVDRQGALWLGTGRGLSRLLPGPDPPESVPAAIVGGVRIDGTAQPIPDLGAVAVGPLKAPSANSRIEIEFFALSFTPGEAPKHQYMLEGIDAWSPPTDQQVVTYPRLPPGSYRFLVRAVRRDGTTSTAPATVAFTIPPPIWARWWFLAIVASVVVLAARTAYRARVARLLEIERIRTRLAMDLHDDIGSTLSQVAVLSEVARQRVGEDRPLSEMLERIAEVSRQLVDAMSDVVWAINPDRDSLQDLAHRMRRFAAEVLDTQKIGLRFDAPAENGNVRLGAEVRREVFLIFKESIHNMLRYARCTRADVRLSVPDASLVLTVDDDGVGLGPTVRGEGLGLRSMRERAGRLGAELSLRSAPGAGTSVRLVVPLGRRRWRGFGGRRAPVEPSAPEDSR